MDFKLKLEEIQRTVTQQRDDAVAILKESLCLKVKETDFPINHFITELNASKESFEAIFGSDILELAATIISLNVATNNFSEKAQ